MRILVLAPHPFYQERGTPIAVDLLVRALSAQGHSIDLLTFHEGEDRDYGPQVTLHRTPASASTRGMRPGFSFKKLISDIALHKCAKALLARHSYDCIHAVEEAAFIARSLGHRFKVPYVFDMDSSMPQQMADKFTVLRPLLPIMRAVERPAIRDAIRVVPMCESLATVAREAGARAVTVLRDISMVPVPFKPDPARGFRNTVSATAPTFLYIGNLERYQGIDLLIDAFARATAAGTAAYLVVVGGREEDVKQYRAEAARRGLSERCDFLGARPLSDMPHLMHDADVLVSPRIAGSNTPMKIYSYLGAGRAILATRLETHTQVLDDQNAQLVEATAEAFADGITQLAGDRELRQRLGAAAQRCAESEHSEAAFAQTVATLYEGIAEEIGSGPERTGGH